MGEIMLPFRVAVGCHVTPKFTLYLWDFQYRFTSSKKMELNQWFNLILCSQRKYTFCLKGFYLPLYIPRLTSLCRYPDSNSNTVDRERQKHCGWKSSTELQLVNFPPCTIGTAPIVISILLIYRTGILKWWHKEPPAQAHWYQNFFL